MASYLIATPKERARRYMRRALRYIRAQLWADIGGSLVMLLVAVVFIVAAFSGSRP